MPVNKASKKAATSRRANKHSASKKAVKKSSPRSPTAKGKKGHASGTSKKAAASGVPSVLLVNMIPRSLSGEANQDSEPAIAVNPANPLQIAASAFTPDPMNGSFAPIYISNDGGKTWTLNSIVPGNDRLTAPVTSR